MKIAKLLTEERKYEYGCAMIYFDFPQIKKLHSVINKEDVYHNPEDDSFGLEDEPHTTLLFGLHSDKINLEDIEEVFKQIEFGECTIYNPSLFQNDEYDVLKFDVKGKGLHEANKLLKKYPHTTKFPDYHPHLTIAYIKPGKGKKYVDKFKGLSFKLVPQKGVYSEPNRKKTDIQL